MYDNIVIYPKNEIRIIPESMMHAPINLWKRCFSWKNHPPNMTAKSAEADLNALVYGAISSETMYI